MINIKHAQNYWSCNVRNTWSDHHFENCIYTRTWSQFVANHWISTLCLVHHHSWGPPTSMIMMRWMMLMMMMTMLMMMLMLIGIPKGACMLIIPFTSLEGVIQYILHDRLCVSPIVFSALMFLLQNKQWMHCSIICCPNGHHAISHGCNSLTFTTMLYSQTLSSWVSSSSHSALQSRTTDFMYLITYDKSFKGLFAFTCVYCL